MHTEEHEIIVLMPFAFLSIQRDASGVNLLTEAPLARTHLLDAVIAATWDAAAGFVNGSIGSFSTSPRYNCTHFRRTNILLPAA